MTLDVREGDAMDRWEYKIADLTEIEKDMTELNRLVPRSSLRET